MKKLLNWIKKHKILTILIAAGILFLVFRLTRKPNASSGFSETKLEAHDITTYHSFVGTVQPDTDVAIIPSVSARVNSVLVEEGDAVMQGETIALLDDTAAQYQIKLKEAVMNSSGTSSYYSIKDAETAYQNYKTALESGLNSSMISAQRSVDSAWYAWDQAKKAYENGKDTSSSAVDAAKKKRDEAKKMMEIAKASLPSDEEIAVITLAYEEAQTALDKAETALQTAATDEELARLAYEAAPEGTPEKDEKQAAWAKAVDEETAAQAEYDVRQAEFTPIEEQFNAVIGLVSLYEDAKTGYEELASSYSKIRDEADTTETKLYDAMIEAENGLRNANVSYDSTALSVRQQLQNYEDTIAKIKANSSDPTSRIELGKLQDDLKNYTITAPVSGTITSLSLKQGEIAASGSAVGVISSLDAMKIEIKVDEYSVLSTKEGLPVQIYIDSIKETYQGVIRYIAENAEIESGVSYYNAEISFVPDEKVRGGMSVEVRLTSVDEKGAMCLPSEAVHYREDDSAYVLVKGESGREERDVVTGVSDGDYVVIKEGLSAEDTVYYVPAAKTSNLVVSWG